jgi:S-DNA-T family DNA segregation ATPase FtsK/SpoIIIE
MRFCYYDRMKKIKAPSQRPGPRPHAPRRAAKAPARKAAKKPPTPQGGWLARRPARPLHPPTPIDEMAGIVIIAVALFLGFLALAPHSVGALSPLGVWLGEFTGRGGVIMAAFVLLVGLEAFIPHQALGVPMLAIALSLLFGCLEGLADLMGGQGGQLGALVGGLLREAVGVPGAWIAIVTVAIIDIQWITRVSMRGPARLLMLPLRLLWRCGRLLQAGWMAGTRGLWRFADEIVSEESEAEALPESEGFVPPVTVKPEAKSGKGSASAPSPPAASPGSPPGGGSGNDARIDDKATERGKKRGKNAEKSETRPDEVRFPDFPPLMEARNEERSSSAGKEAAEPEVEVRAAMPVEPEGASAEKPLGRRRGETSKPVIDDDVEIPGYEDDASEAFPAGEEPIFDDLDEDAPPWDEEGETDDERTTELARAWAEQESPGARQLSLPLPDLPLAPSGPPRVIQYRLPSVDLLNVPTAASSNESAMDFSRIIVETLNSFGVATRIVNVEKGPTVTRYELQPARGVKVSKITSLNNDIALALAAQAIRIEAPIPGKSAIGIEVPNSRVDAVPMREIIESHGFQNGQGCMLALGKDISGRAVVADLLRMPHLLIAGATGSGKSVCLNTVIVSMLYRFNPQQVQMVMVDPKRVELSIFEGIPHLANTHANPNQRIVKDAKTGTLVLKQATEIMNQRFELLSQNRVRNIAEYNAKVATPMPYLVIIVDELAQLMQISARSVEGYLQELAQMGRAAGIHLILATQRPSVDVLTGTIKSNFPARIAFAVSAQVDSRTILDRGGAEKLLGRGDMLFSPTDAELRRVQGCLITLEETERVVDFWRQQEAPDNLAQLSLEAKTTDDLMGGQGDGGEDEDLLREALRVIKETKLASASNLQRKLQIGYPRAARLVDELEQRGFLGPANGSKPRKILFLEEVE